MAKEIHEQPEVVGHTLARYIDMASERIALPLTLPFDFRDIQRISITACGTASYAGSIARYWFERLSRLPVEVDVASEFRYREAPLRKGDLAIFISQSGETADTLAALRYAKEQGLHTLSVVNVTTSTIARESETVLPTLAGPEIGVASTKAFTCQLTVLASLAIAAGKARGILSDQDEAKLVHGPVSYTHLDVYKRQVPVIVIAPSGPLFEKTVSNMQEVAARGGRIILMTDAKGAAEATVESLVTITLPDMPATVTPLVYAIPVQLLAYHTAVIMGTDVDQPRNLAKSVTVE